MKKQILLILALLIGFPTFSQQKKIEEYRAKGYEFKVAKTYDSAIFYYEKILIEDSSDYDANWELASLNFKEENYKKSLVYYTFLYEKEDSIMDKELILPMAEIYLKLDKIKKAISFYEQSITISPEEIPLYYKLAKAYSWDGKINEAIKTYADIIDMDSTLSEAWAGIGKMKYWQEKPHTASWYYQKALEMDPTNEEILAEYKTVQNELKYKLSAGLKAIEELQDEFDINALIQKYSVEKRITDNFNIQVNGLIDFSDRDFSASDTSDGTRWYDSYWAKISWITNHHKISLFGGASYVESRFTGYGINYLADFDIWKFKIKNSFTAKYDYFFYWNKVGRNSVSDNISIKYKKFTLSGGGEYGIVDSVELWDDYYKKYDKDETIYYGFNVELGYEIISKPKITVSANYSFLDYQYKSPLYYSPFERNLTGFSSTFYHKMGNFYVYAGGSYNIGTETQYEELTTDNFQRILPTIDSWNADLEIGYNLKPFTFILNGNKFYNPYYESLVVGFTITADL